MRFISKDAWLREVKKVDWPKVLNGHIRATQGGLDIKGLLLLEAGLRQIEDQLIRKGRGNRDAFGLGSISRDDVLAQATDLRRRWFREIPWDKTKARSIFDWRWKSVHDYHRCLVIYCTKAPRWTRLLDELAERASQGLQAVVADERSLFSLIDEVTLRDIKLRVRLVKSYIFLLSLAMDSDWKTAANQAYRDFSEGQAERWIPVYDKAVGLLGVKYHPGWNSRKLNALVSALAANLAIEVACSDDESKMRDEDDKLLLAEGIKALVCRAVDPSGRPNLFDE